MSFAGARHLTLLDEFLVDSFDGAELVRFLDEQFGAAFVAELPGTAASPRSLAFHAVRCLHRHGKIDEQLITALSRARPARVLQLQGLSRCLVTEESKEQDQQTVVWRRAGQAKDNPRIQLVEALDTNAGVYALGGFHAFGDLAVGVGTGMAAAAIHRRVNVHPAGAGLAISGKF